MSDAPKTTADRLNTIEAGWKKLASTATFGGMTLEQFTAAIKPSRDARTTISELDTKMTDAINLREAADKASNQQADLVVNGVIGDVKFGPDSSLYEEMGYVRKSERKKGLTRKKKTPPAK